MSILISIVRTLSAFFICVILWFISGAITNILPAILLLPYILLYYQTATLIYFVIANDDIFSTILGIVISLAFIILYILNIGMDVPIFRKLLYIIGIGIGILQTIKSVDLRFKQMRTK